MQSRFHQFHVCRDKQDLEFRVLERIKKIAQESITKTGSFSIVLAGGSTPKTIYQQLSRTIQQWAKWHVYFGDERCLSADDPDRNSKMVTSVWLDQVSIPKKQIHIIPAELGAGSSALSYSNTLKDVAIFDLVLLGLGEDGHTASLFPNNDLGTSLDAPDVIPVFNSPKLPAERVTISVNRLSNARKIIYMVSGNNKKDAMIQWKKGNWLPVAEIKAKESIDVYHDTKLS